MSYELKYDENCMIYVEGHEVDDSFDHEFGTEVRSHFEIDSINVVVWIRGNDYDITHGLAEKELEHFKAWATAKIESDLPEVE